MKVGVKITQKVQKQLRKKKQGMRGYPLEIFQKVMYLSVAQKWEDTVGK